LRQVVRAVSATLVLLAGVLLLPSAADAAVKGRIVSIQAKNGQLTVVFAAAGLGPAQTIDPKSVQLALDGALLTARVQTGATATAATGVARRVVLAIDTSGSMAGARIDAAKAAALAYLERAPADVSIGLVTFSDTATSSVDPTSDRGVVRSAIGRLQAHGNTALYDAVQLAVQALGRSGDRSILLVSDGLDDGSRHTLAQAETALRTSKTSLNAVLIGGAGAQQALTALSEVAGGRVVSTRAAADLTSAFVQAARDADKEVVLTAAIPARFTGGEAPVYVTASAAGQQITDTAIAVNLVSGAKVAADPALFGPRAVAPVHGVFAHRTILYAGLVAVFLGACVVFGTATSAFAGPRGQLTRRLLPYGRSARRHEETPSTSVRATAVG
jgi:tight adherence protein B